MLTPAVVERLPLAAQEARAALAPALVSDFRKTVAPTLALVAPAGMTTQDQQAWLAAAAETLSGMPADLLEFACREARRTVDHPSKIVKTIFDYAGSEWARRKRNLATVAGLQRLAMRPQSEKPAEPAGDAGAIQSMVDKFLGRAAA